MGTILPLSFLQPLRLQASRVLIALRHVGHPLINVRLSVNIHRMPFHRTYYDPFHPRILYDDLRQKLTGSLYLYIFHT